MDISLLLSDFYHYIGSLPVLITIFGFFLGSTGVHQGHFEAQSTQKKAYFCDDMQPWMSAKVLLSWFDSSSNLICHNIMNQLSVYQTVYWRHDWGLRWPNLPKICNISQNMLLEWSWMGVLVLFELGQFIWPLSTSIIILQFSTQSNRGTLEHLEV